MILLCLTCGTKIEADPMPERTSGVLADQCPRQDGEGRAPCELVLTARPAIGGQWRAPAARPCLVCGRSVMALATRPDPGEGRGGYVLLAFIHEGDGPDDLPCFGRVSVAVAEAFIAFAAQADPAAPPAHVH